MMPIEQLEPSVFEHLSLVLQGLPASTDGRFSKQFCLSLLTLLSTNRLRRKVARAGRERKENSQHARAPSEFSVF